MFVLVGILCAGLAPGSSRAQSGRLAGRSAAEADASSVQADAKRRFTHGLELFQEGDFAGALAEFRKAYASAPKYHVLYNLGQVCYQVQDYACALTEFTHYLAEGGTAITPGRRAAVERDVEKLRTRVARVTVHTNAPGATISIDDKPVGEAPLADAVLVSIGTRRLSASLDGRGAIVRTVTLAGEESASVELRFPPVLPGSSAAGPSALSLGLPAPTALAAPISTNPSVLTSAANSAAGRGTPPPVERSTTTTSYWPLWALTAGLATVAGIMGIAALREASSLDHERRTIGTSREELDASGARAARFALTANLLGGAAVACGGLTLYFTVAQASRAEMPGASPATSDVPTARPEAKARWFLVRGTY